VRSDASAHRPEPALPDGDAPDRGDDGLDEEPPPPDEEPPDDGDPPVELPGSGAPPMRA